MRKFLYLLFAIMAAGLIIMIATSCQSTHYCPTYVTHTYHK